MPSVFESSDNASTSMLNLHGLPGSGKTGAALMLSKHWPGTQWILQRIAEVRADKPPSKRVSLLDILYIGHDKGGLNGYKEIGIDIPHTVDVGKLIAPLRKGENRAHAKDIIDAQNIIGKDARSLCVGNPAIKLVVRDTITRLDKRLQEYWSRPGNLPTNRDGKDDTQAMWRIMLQNHIMDLELYEALSGVLVVNLFHSKAIDDLAITAKAGQQAKQIIAKLGSQTVRFIPDLSGQSLNAYTGDAIEFAATSTYDKGKKEYSYHLHTIEGPNGERTKNRLRASVGAEKFPADQLRGILLRSKLLPV